MPFCLKARRSTNWVRHHTHQNKKRKRHSKGETGNLTLLSDVCNLTRLFYWNSPPTRSTLNGRGDNDTNGGRPAGHSYRDSSRCLVPSGRVPLRVGSYITVSSFTVSSSVPSLYHSSEGRFLVGVDEGAHGRVCTHVCTRV